MLTIYPRSGLGFKYRFQLDNSVGVIDSDYRGEIMVALYNQGTVSQTVLPGERVAQLVLTPYVSADFVESETLSDTVRGQGGFGSTGK